MSPETKAILEQFERRQQTRFAALGELLNQSFEAMAMDRQRLYQMLAQREESNAARPAPVPDPAGPATPASS